MYCRTKELLFEKCAIAVIYRTVWVLKMHGGISNQLLKKTAWNFCDIGYTDKTYMIRICVLIVTNYIWCWEIVQGLFSAWGITFDKVLIWLFINNFYWKLQTGDWSYLFTPWTLLTGLKKMSSDRVPIPKYMIIQLSFLTLTILLVSMSTGSLMKIKQVSIYARLYMNNYSKLKQYKRNIKN